MNRGKLSFVKVVVACIFSLALTSALFANGNKEQTGSAGEEEKAVLSILCFQGYAEPAWVEPCESYLCGYCRGTFFQNKTGSGRV